MTKTNNPANATAAVPATATTDKPASRSANRYRQMREALDRMIAAYKGKNKDEQAAALEAAESLLTTTRQSADPATIIKQGTAEYSALLQRGARGEDVAHDLLKVMRRIESAQRRLDNKKVDNASKKE